VAKAVSAAESKLGQRGRVLLRPSGTEPVIRVMVEGEPRDTVEELALDIADCVRKAAA
jgi:phosphoglucosamine mutase